MVYLEDLILWERNYDDIHNLAMELRYLGVDWEQEDYYYDFLCVNLY